MKKTVVILHFVVIHTLLTHFIETKKAKEYAKRAEHQPCRTKTSPKVRAKDDPKSEAYKELVSDFRKFEKAIELANSQNSSMEDFYLVESWKISCKERCDETRDAGMYCHCDSLCTLFTDCCVDYWPSCNVKEKPFNNSMQEIWDCVNAKIAQGKSNRNYGNMGYMMKNHCPSNCFSANQCNSSCDIPDSDHSNIVEHLPVTGVDGNTYRNEYCAQCHGITNITHWGVMVSCSNLQEGANLTYGSLYQQENCTWYYSPANEYRNSASPCTRSTQCQSLVNTSESITYRDLVNKCKVYSHLITADNIVYKNFHCASCNGKKVKDFEYLRTDNEKAAMSMLSLFFDYNSLVRMRLHGHDGNGSGNEKPEKSHDDVILGYITTVGLSLSITCLVAVVITYIRFSTLQTVPGLVLLALSSSLIAYQGLLLASPYISSRTSVCKAMAIGLHFAVLLSFAWMTVMSYDVSKTFSRNTKNLIRKSSRFSFYHYVIFTTCTSGGIVALAFILQENEVVDVAYGESISCWIGNKLALKIFFYVPVSIMLLHNTVSFTWTIFSIRNTMRLTKGIKKSGKSHNFAKNTKVYCKLSTVMGVTWFLGFGATENTIVHYLFVILNSLQGVFIFVSFVLNKRTVNMWRNTSSV